MHIKRVLFSQLEKQLKKENNKVILLFGARQVGKTTLVNEVLNGLKYNFREVSGDDLRYHDVLSSRNTDKLKEFVEGYDGLFIDEAQKIPEIGINLKILHDNLPHLKIIVTGSAALDLASKTREALTGRTITYQLYPIAIADLRQQYNRFDIESFIDSLLIYGSYPETFNIGPTRERESYLTRISQDYLYKDVIELVKPREGHKMQSLLKHLAFQVGSQVSMNKLGNNLDLDSRTVAHYIDLLEKSFVIFRLNGFSKNLAKEMRKMDKIYFHDLGIRNAIINNFNPPNLRNDMGQLWENFCIIERIKTLNYQNTSFSPYFWRINTGAELDYIEEREGSLSGYEIKWGNKKIKAPKAFMEAYKKENSRFTLVNQQNFYDFVLDQDSNTNQKLDL